MARLVPSVDTMEKDIKTEITDNASIRYIWAFIRYLAF